MKIVTAFITFLFAIQGCVGFRVVCVYTNWSQYRPDGGKFLPEDVDPTLCTHLIYVYAKLKGNKLAAVEWNDEGTRWNEGMYQRVNNLKDINPDLKTLLGVGGWMMGSKDFSRLAAGRTSRKIFARTTVKFLRDRHFDGLTIDWQHPTKRGGRAKDKENYSLLLKELRRAFNDEGKKTKRPPLLLTAGVSASRDIIDNAYEVGNLTKYTDFLNVMAYDLHGDWDNYTGHPSQLYSREDEFGPSSDVNVDGAMQHWMSLIPDKSKLILGVSTYGRTFTLRKARHHEYNVPTTGPGLAGEFTQQPGMLAYYERCLQYADAPRVWDPVSQVAYWYSGDQWIAGEDIDSIFAKVNWMRYNLVGGIMLSSLDMDDYSGMYCTGELYPLLHAIHHQLTAPLPPKPKPVANQRRPMPVPTLPPSPFLETTTTFSWNVTSPSYMEFLPSVDIVTSAGSLPAYLPDVTTPTGQGVPVQTTEVAMPPIGLPTISTTFPMFKPVQATKPAQPIPRPIAAAPTVEQAAFAMSRTTNIPAPSDSIILHTVSGSATVTNSRWSEQPYVTTTTNTANQVRQGTTLSPITHFTDNANSLQTQPKQQSSRTTPLRRNDRLDAFMKNAGNMPTHSLINNILLLLERSYSDQPVVAPPPRNNWNNNQQHHQRQTVEATPTIQERRPVSRRNRNNRVITPNRPAFGKTQMDRHNMNGRVNAHRSTFDNTIKSTQQFTDSLLEQPNKMKMGTFQQASVGRSRRGQKQSVW